MGRHRPRRTLRCSAAGAGAGRRSGLARAGLRVRWSPTTGNSSSRRRGRCSSGCWRPVCCARPEPSPQSPSSSPRPGGDRGPHRCHDLVPVTSRSRSNVTDTIRQPNPSASSSTGRQRDGEGGRHLDSAQRDDGGYDDRGEAHDHAELRRDARVTGPRGDGDPVPGSPRRRDLRSSRGAGATPPRREARPRPR